MTTALTADTRTLTIDLDESDWRALRAAEPDAVGWIRARIRERLNPDAAAPASPATPEFDSWGEY